MPTFLVPNSACIHTIKSFLGMNAPFSDPVPPARLELHPRWAHMDPMALSMAAAWGGWCQRQGIEVEVENIAGSHANYAARMKLFYHLGVNYPTVLAEREEAGRFMPITQVKSASELQTVIGNVSALLHLDEEPNGLNAVQYCVSELVRNVLEHSGSPEGAYVCAQRYLEKGKKPSRVTIAVADCGEGIAAHLGDRYKQARDSDMIALSLAMQPGITGALAGMYGTPNNAGAGLFITRTIAKATGGYFVLASGKAAFRVNQHKEKKAGREIYLDALDDPKSTSYPLTDEWHGTVAAMEIFTDRVPDFPEVFQWIRSQLPTKKTAAGKIRFT